MANNQSCYMPDSFVVNARMLQYTLYGISGGLNAFFNAIIFVAIAKYHALRNHKDYIMIAALSLADTIFGLGHLTGSFYRLATFAMDVAYCKIPRFYCLFLPQTSLWRIGGIASPAMLLVVSIDRLVTVSRPLQYLSANYARIFVACIYIPCIVLLFVYYIHPIQRAYTPVSAYCSTGSIIDRELYSMHLLIASVLTTLSVVVYGFAIVLFQKQHGSRNTITVGLSQADRAHVAERLKWERKITVTLGISSAFTFGLISVPKLAGSILQAGIVSEWLPILSRFSSYFSILHQVNALANFFIYGLRQKEMKTAIKGLFTCKHLPDDLRNWNH